MKRTIVGLIILLAILIMAVPFLSGCDNGQEAKSDAGIYVLIGRDGVASVGWLTEKQSGGVSNADESLLKKGTSLQMDFDIADGETFSLTAYDENNVVLAEGEGFVWHAGSRLEIELTDGTFTAK